MISLLDNALSLASFGLSIVPVHHPVKHGEITACSCSKGACCSSIGKHPLPTNWGAVATKEPESLKAWWRTIKKANTGVVTGQPSGIIVVDIDPRHGGDESLDNLQVKHGKLPDTAMVITGSGGSHIYFKHPGQIVKNSAGAIGAGIDIRGDGGFVVGPGSLHASGGYYEWEASSEPADVGFAEMPEWLKTLVYAKPASSPIQTNNGDVVAGGRNVWLTSLAGSLRCKGCGYRAIAAAVWHANIEHCNPPLSKEECRDIANSMMRYNA